MAGIEGFRKFGIVLVVCWTRVTVLWLDCLCLVVHLGLLPHRIAWSLRFLYFTLRFKMISRNTRTPNCLCVNVGIEYYLLNDRRTTYRPWARDLPLFFSLFSSKRVFRLYLELDGDVAKLFVKSNFLPNPMAAPSVGECVFSLV